MKHYLVFKIITGIIAIASLILGIINQCSQCNQIKKSEEQSLKIDSLNYQLNANNNKPVLKMLDSHFSGFLVFQSSIPKDIILPKFDTVRVDSNIYTLVLKEDTSISDSTRLYDLEGEIELATKISVTNVGNTTAILYLSCFSDSVSDYTYLRDEFEKDFSKIAINFKPSPDFFKNEILPGDSTTIELKGNIRYFSTGKIVIHCILFYKNPLGHLYDTYFWIIIENVQIIFIPQYKWKKIKSGYALQFRLVPEDPDKNLKSTLANQSYKIYSESEATKFDVRYKKLMNRMSVD